jgi:uncharacterized membrane protein YcaP (DUF421 family)
MVIYSGNYSSNRHYVYYHYYWSESFGKEGRKQLSIFELVVIIGLGSAAGDPMFNKDVGIISSFIVFAVIILLYTIVTYFIAKNKKIEQLIEGKSICLIENGEFSIENFKKRKSRQ